MDKKIFSIIVPMYNAGKTIERTLSSFISNNDYIKEVILVNDKSNDDTLKKIYKFNGFFNIKIINNEENVGAGLSRKIGMKNATGKWITFVDSDDCLTPSSLRYVYNKIVSNKKIILLHCQTIYYESGNFNKETIEHSDTSCGGNFYKRKYLIRNGLYPHEKLSLVEDEYFNEKIIRYIKECDIFTNKNAIEHYDYPVYEVHHDIEDGYSLAIRNWCDYLCKYRLLYKEYLTEDFIKVKKLRGTLLEEYYDNFIFCFFLAQGLMLDHDVNFSIVENIPNFKRSLDYLYKTFGKTSQDMIIYYKSNTDNVKAILSSAISTIGFEYKEYIYLDKFVNNIAG